MVNPYQSPEAPTPANALTASRAIACPHCGGPAMSLFRKSALNPGRRMACQSCGARVGISWRGAAAAGLPALTVAGFLATACYLGAQLAPQKTMELASIVGGWSLLQIAAAAAAVVGVGAGSCGAIQTWFVPLIKR